MTHEAKVFGFECDTHGARLVVVREPIFPACLSDGEIDYEIDALKRNLDAVARAMKRAIRKQALKPLSLIEPTALGDRHRSDRSH